MQKIIWVDIDDTICASFWAVAKTVSEMYGINFSYEDITDYHFKNIKILENIECDWLGIFRETFKNRHHEFIPITGSQESILTLRNEGYLIAAITARWEGFIDITHEWLSNHFFGLIDEIHFLGTEHSYHISKAEKCKELGVLCMVEDHIDHCLDLANHGVKTYLLERPWNRQRTETHPLITRVKDWGEITSHLYNS